MTPVTRNCEYCNEPFTPSPGPMAAKQRFCCTNHRVYASREGAPTNKFSAPKQHKSSAPKQHARQQANDEATPINWDSLPGSVRDKLEATRRRIRKELEWAFEPRVQAEVEERLKFASQRMRQEHADCRRVLDARKGIFTRSDYDLIRSCLHPDSRASASDRKLANAFRVFNEADIVLLNEKDRRTTTLPSMEDL